MLQHLLVTLVFALCLYFVVRRIVHFVSRVKQNDVRCNTCTETSCPLRKAGGAKQCECGGMK